MPFEYAHRRVGRGYVGCKTAFCGSFRILGVIRLATVATILGPNGKPIRSGLPRQEGVARRSIAGKYDAAVTNEENTRHWANADSLSAVAANSPQVRRKLRERARYERDSNSYASGIVETVANDTIGTGPRLQLHTDDAALNDALASDFEAWTAAVGLAEKLRTFREARTVDGESFIRLIDNPRLRTPVKLDLQLIEADQVMTPWISPLDPMAVDGIRFDRAGNPIEYHVLPYHPGDSAWFGGYGDFEAVSALNIIHWFKARRPGQRRGVSELTPALPLFALLRRYTLASLTAAETAAMLAALIKTTMEPNDDTSPVTTFDTQVIERGMMMALPEGYDVTQLKAEQPTTTYPQFKAEILREIARCLSVPFIVAAGDASGANYSSGRLDYQVYDRSIGVDQYFLETAVLDRILVAWLAEARLVDRSIPLALDEMPPHQWYWDGRAYINPSDEADAATTRLTNLTTTLADEWAARGHDWRAKIRQRAEEVALVTQLGLTPEQAAPTAARASEPAMSATAPPPIKVIRASGDAARSLSLTAAVSLDVEAKAADGTPKRPTFSITAYTGAPMTPAGFYTPVIVELSGLKASRDKLPILLDHDPANIVGYAGATISASGVVMDGTITGDDGPAAKVVTHARNGFPWQASIGATIVRHEILKAGEKAVVNGREVIGPMMIVREARLQETSFVAIGADGQTSANVVASNPTGTSQGALTVFETWLQAKGFDPMALSDDQKAVLKAAFDAEQKPATPPVQAAAATPSVTLADIFAEQRKETERVEEITAITAQALRERPMMADALERLSRSAIEAKVVPRDYELEVLRATRTPSGAVTFAVHAKDSRASGQAIEAAICKSGGLEGREKLFDERVLQAADDRFRDGLGLCDVLHIAARERGWQGHSVKSDIGGVLRACFPREIKADGFSTLSLPNIFSNVANKFLASGFNAVESTWRDISARRSASDFKQISTMSLTGSFAYEKVGSTGELKHATAGELLYNNQVETYGRMFVITRKHIIDDDLGALTSIPRKLGRGAAVSLNTIFWGVFLDNSTFFTSGRANYISGGTTVLSLDSLGAANTTFMNQTDADGLPVAIMPAILLVPNALYVAASNFMNSTYVANNTTANTTTLGNNPFSGMFKVVRSSYLSNSSLTGYSTTGWYLLADPNDLPVIETAFLNGRETPTVESADADFDMLGVQMRGYFDFGVALQEYRAGVKSAGA